MPSAPAGQLPHAPGGQTPFEALWRTREYFRPYRWQLAAMLALAFGAVGTEIVIPLVTKAVIDGPIAHGDRRLLIPLGVGAIALGAAEAMLNMIRRWVQASAVTGMELAMRDDIYAHLQHLDASFHGSWQSGQLLSRATTDLSAIRRFAGCVFLPVTVACFRFERRYRVLSRRAQDQQGDLATYVEDAAAGIRVLKALGRRDEAAGRHGTEAARVFRTQLDMARLRGTFWAGLDLIPNIMIGLILLLGTLAASRHELSLGGLVAFITLTLQLVWPIEAMGYILASGQEAATAAQRIYEILDTEPAIADPGVTAPPTVPGPRAVPGPGGVPRRSAGARSEEH